METIVTRAELFKAMHVNKVPDLGYLLNALQVLPDEDQRWVVENVFYFSTYGKTYGSRMSRGLCATKEVIYLSEKIFPVLFDLNSWDTRLFVLIVLHETAHAKREHKCRIYDGIDQNEYDRQEREATADAIEWFNIYASKNNIELVQEEEELASRNKLGVLVDEWEWTWSTNRKACLAKMLTDAVK